MTLSVTSQPSSPGNSAEPRLYRRNEYDDTVGDVALACAPSMGYELLDWQADLVRDMGAVGPDRKWVHPRVGMSVERQQGKSALLVVWVAVLAAVAGYKVLWTDHNYSTTVEMLSRFRDIFGARVGDLSRGVARWRRELVEVCSQTGQEWMRFRSGGVIQFSTRTKTSRLGFSFDVVVYDEAQELTGVHTQVINPTTTSGDKHNLQLIYAGTPKRAGSDAEVFANVRAQAWEGGEQAQDLLWLEYGVAEVGDIWDVRRWEKVMPSLGFHADARAIATGMKDMDELAAAQEYLGYWLPALEQCDPPLIGAKLWAESRIPRRIEYTGSHKAVAYGVKFSADGSYVALAVATLHRPGERVLLSLPFCRRTAGGTDWLVSWLAARPTRAKSVCVDGRSAAGALCDALEALGMPSGYVMRPSTDEAITAANLILEAARTKGVMHVDNEALDLSAATSTKRVIGKAGGWGFGGDDSAPIEACGLALLALQNSKRNPTRKARVS